MPDFNPVDLIITKRNGGALTPDQIAWLVDAYTRGDVPDYQMSAFLMAALLRGMNDEEAFALTHAMLHSGVVLDLSDIPGTKVDKHSTGGVGDKVSLILAPLVAACGVPVPMISGRGLGHSGGTLDKLEAIPGFRTDLPIDAYRRQLARLGVVMIGQTDEIAPADRKLYALRDVTGTVEFIPFIAASIMSKKLAEGIDALVLDVKCGQGAFMKTEADARRLAETLVGLGERFGKRTVARLTDMNTPLGRAIGNWPETAEAIRCLHGEEVPDVMEVTYALAGEMLCLGGAAPTPEDGVEQARRALAAGRALDVFIALVEAQGGDASVVRDPDRRADAAPVAEVRAGDDARGFVADLDALRLGWTAVALGAGRRRKEDPVDPTAGITLAKKPGDPVRPGDVLAYLHTRRHDALPAFEAAVAAAFTFADAPPPPASRLLDRYADGRWANPPSPAS
ncbi:MAG: pyrimidine-nucleoside phosphorylase [Rhodothermaceae bacterium]|nr:MAG: pyrimidine-nucleoside phosphorylase [Rhodothermaceae bacterium]